MTKNPAAILLTLTVPLWAGAAESAYWYLDDNKVTYAYEDLSGISASGTSLNFSMFNSDNVAAAEGLSGTYTLSHVLVSIDGTINGVFRFYNMSSDPSRSVTSATLQNNPGLTFTVNGTSVAEQFSYTDPNTPFTVGAQTSVEHNFSATGNGPAQTDIFTALQGFVGGPNETLATTVTPYLSINTSSSPDILSGLNNLQSSVSSVSITYFYDYTPVPEPSGLALLFVGCAAIMGRRRKLK